MQWHVDNVTLCRAHITALEDKLVLHIFRLIHVHVTSAVRKSTRKAGYFNFEVRAHAHKAVIIQPHWKSSFCVLPQAIIASDGQIKSHSALVVREFCR